MDKKSIFNIGIKSTKKDVQKVGRYFLENYFRYETKDKNNTIVLYPKM